MTRRDLERWVLAFTGVRVPSSAVCQGHSAPLDMFARQVLERPPLALWHGPRGSGKSFLSAIDTHIASRFFPRHQTRILGGSLGQSEQIQQALREVVLNGRGPAGESDSDSVARVLKNQVHYRNGSEVSLRAASSTSVRGPHVPSLKLDEVDEIDSDIRESAMGMAMDVRGRRSSVLMTSTWHRLAGPMAELIDKGRAGAFPVNTYCVFEVLERCPEERSGPRLEKCPECPLKAWCHADRDAHPSGLPKAKRSAGHYTIDSLIQKVKAVSLRVFESDYLCLRPRLAGVWFSMFDETTHVREAAEYEPNWPVHLAIDPGVHTGAIWFKAVPRLDGAVIGSTSSPTITSRASRPRRTHGRSSSCRGGTAGSAWSACASRWTPPAVPGRPSVPRSAASTNAPGARARTGWNPGPSRPRPTASSSSRPCSNRPTSRST